MSPFYLGQPAHLSRGQKWYPTDAVDRVGILAFRSLKSLLPARQLILSVRRLCWETNVDERIRTDDAFGLGTAEIGDTSTWKCEQQKLNARRNAKPWVLRIDQEDLDHLPTQPA
jgi:hypothetical protein